MATLSNAQKAPLFIDGEQWPANSPGVISSDPAIASVGAGTDGVFFVFGEAAGEATISVSSQGRIGSLAITVTPEPWEVTLGTPEPK